MRQIEGETMQEMSGAHASTPRPHGAGWLVPSASGPGQCYVEVIEHTMRWTCPSWVYRGMQLKGNCKHVRRVLAMKHEVRMA
jgi:hypothetical protein